MIHEKQGLNSIKRAKHFIIALILLSFVESRGAQEVHLHSFAEIFEPSAVVQLADGSVLVAEDEGEYPLFLFSLGTSGGLPELIQKRLSGWDLLLEDLEGSARGKNGDVFMITSHFQKGTGSKTKRRERLLRFTVTNDRIVDIQTYGGLRADIEKALQRYAQGEITDYTTPNIEGLVFQVGLEKLYIGLRNPLKGGKSIILLLDNPYDLFTEQGASAKLSQLIALDLAGGGIRAMTYDSHGGRYLLANEVKNKKGKRKPAVWAWSGNSQDLPVRLSLPAIEGIKNIEGMTFVNTNTTRYLLLVCDDGNRKKEKGGHYLLLENDLVK